MVKKTVFSMEYRELEQLIEKTYGHMFEYVADVECGNDCAQTYTLQKEPLGDYELARVTEFKSTGRGQWIVYALMQDMVNKEVLEAGDYVVEVSW